jgi:hypothetical protein
MDKFDLVSFLQWLFLCLDLSGQEVSGYYLLNYLLDSLHIDIGASSYGPPGLFSILAHLTYLGITILFLFLSGFYLMDYCMESYLILYSINSHNGCTPKSLLN